MRFTVNALAGAALLLWWMPTIALALAFAWGVRHQLRRADRLLDAGRVSEARRTFAALERDIGAAKRRARPGKGGR